MSRRKVMMQFLLGITEQTKEFIARVGADGDDDGVADKDD